MRSFSQSFIIPAIFLFLAVSLNGWADERDPSPRHDSFHSLPLVESADLDDPEEVEGAVEFIHKALEGTDPKAGWVKKFFGNFNFARHGKNGIRANNLKPGQPHAKNITFLLLFVSHPMETASGFVYSLWAMVNDVPVHIAGPMSTFLYSLAVPGIDWGCIILTGTYLGSEDFRDFVNWGRVYSVKGVKGASKITGLTDALNALIHYESADEYIRSQLTKIQGSATYLTEPGDEHVLDLLDEDGGRICRLELMNREGNVILRQVTFDREKLDYPEKRGFRRLIPGNISRVRARLKKVLKPFGVNIKDAVLLAYDHLAKDHFDSAVAPFFVQSMEFFDPQAKKFVSRRAKTEEHPHSHGAGHDHDHSVQLESHEIAAPGDLTENQIRIQYHLPAIMTFIPPFHLEWAELGRHLAARSSHRLGQLLSMILHPVETANRGFELLFQGGLALSKGMAWVYHNPGEVAYHLKRGALLIPLSLLKTLKIGSQLSVSTLEATAALMKTATTPVSYCQKKLLEAGGWPTADRKREEHACPGCGHEHPHHHH